MGFTDETVIRASQSQVSANLDGEAVILAMDKGEYFGLDGVGQLVWELLAEPRRFDELSAAVLAAFEVDERRCRDDLEALLASLEGEGLIEHVTDPSLD